MKNKDYMLCKYLYTLRGISGLDEQKEKSVSLLLHYKYRPRLTKSLRYSYNTAPSLLSWSRLRTRISLRIVCLLCLQGRNKARRELVPSRSRANRKTGQNGKISFTWFECTNLPFWSYESEQQWGLLLLKNGRLFRAVCVREAIQRAEPRTAPGRFIIAFCAN